MTQEQQIQKLLEIANRVIELNRLEAAEKDAKEALSEGYKAFKGAQGVDHIGRDTPEWEAMKLATSGEFGVLRRARTDARNAKRRMDSAIRKYRQAAAKEVI